MMAATTDEAAAGHIQQEQHRFRILDTTLVAPSAAAAEVALPARSIPLTFFDVKWLHHPPVERVLLYRLSSGAGAGADIVSGLRTSLSQALRAFYPMAGHVRMPCSSSSGRHELCYTPGDAVPFTTAEYDVGIDQLLSSSTSSVQVPVAMLAPLVPRLPKGRKVLAVQATRLLGGGGLAIGVTVHHTTCDGAGSTHFLHTWAALAARAIAGAGADVPPPPPPVLDRELIPDPRGLYGLYLRDMPPMVSQDDDLEFVLGKQQNPGEEDRALATFTLSPQLLQSIKSAVAGEAARRGMAAPPPRCSSIVATYGFVWSCYCRARAAAAARSSSETHFLLSVDQRSRLPVPVPANYLGNCCCPAIARAPTAELAASPPGGLFAACAAVAAAVDEEVRGEGAQDRWDTCVARVKQAVATGTMLSVAGSPRFRVYDLDFGFGRPAQVDMVSVAKTGAIAVADAPAGEGAGGGVELGISLTGAHMDRFRQSVADQMAWLRSSQIQQ